MLLPIWQLRVRVPQLHLVVAAGGGQEVLLVGAKRDTFDIAVAGLEGLGLAIKRGRIHHNTSRASVPQASLLPTWLNATLRTVAWQSSVLLRRRAVVSHSRILPSWPPLASILPSGLNATLFTCPPCPPRGWPICSPVVGFHSRTVPPLPPVARNLPSGLNATVKTAPRAL